MEKELTTQQQVFVQAYTGRHMGNGMAAARAAGYKDPDGQSWDLLHGEPYAHVQAAIKARMRELAMPDDEILVRLAEHARGNIDAFVTVNGHVKIDLQKARKAEAMGLVKKLSVRTKEQVGSDGKAVAVDEHLSLELYSAQTALDILAECAGLKKGDLAGAEEIAVVIRRAAKADDGQGS